MPTQLTIRPMDPSEVCTVLLLPAPWPPALDRQRAVSFGPDIAALLTYCADGHIRLAIEGYPVADAGRFELSQQITNDGNGCHVILSVSRDGAALTVRVNGEEVSPGSVSLHQVWTCSTGEAYLHPGAAEACRAWVDRRKTLYAPFLQATAGKVAVSPSDELGQLDDAISRLERSADAALAGDVTTMPSLRADLRALLVEKERNGKLNPSYCPLLFRVAARYSLALPVFALPDRSTSPPEVPEPDFAHLPREASMRQRFPTHAVTDFQGVLSDVLVVFTDRQQGASTHTAQLILSRAAETLGGAHYDSSLPAHIAFLRGVQLDATTLDFARLAVALGKNMLRCVRESAAGGRSSPASAGG